MDASEIKKNAEQDPVLENKVDSEMKYVDLVTDIQANKDGASRASDAKVTSLQVTAGAYLVGYVNNVARMMTDIDTDNPKMMLAVNIIAGLGSAMSLFAMVLSGKYFHRESRYNKKLESSQSDLRELLLEREKASHLERANESKSDDSKALQ